MNKKAIVLFLALFMCAGIIMTSHTRFEQDKEEKNREIRRDGMHFLKMISLSYEGFAWKGDKNYLLRELSLVASNKKIAYLIIHGMNDDRLPVVTFPSPDIGPEIPLAVRAAALASTGTLIQDFTAPDQNTYLEFSRPVYGRGKPVAVIRLGMHQDQSRFFTLGNLIFPLQVFFFIGMGMVCVYYWFTLMLRPFQNFEKQTRLSQADTAPGGEHVGAMIQRLEHLMSGLYEKTQDGEKKNRELFARIKVIEYEYRQMHDIFDSLDFGVLLMDMKDTVFFVNDYFLRLLGKDRNALTGRIVFDGLDHDDLIAFVRKLSLMEEAGKERQMQTTFPKVHPDRWYQASSYPLVDAEDTVFGRMIRLTDISLIKTTEKAQKDFINHIAHELRTPLTNIKAYNEMIMDGEISDPEMQKEFFNTINDETIRLSDLIKNILKLAETEMGQIAVKKELVKTKWLVKSSLEAVEAVALEKQIRLTANLPDNLPKISGDKEMLKAALINVLGNAVKYTPEQGQVEFSIREAGESVVFEVEDTGFGIDAKDLPHVFEKFYRSENDLVTAETGSGLGLAITAEIVKTHGGTIEVASDPSKGSKFTITLPKGDLQIG